MHGGHHSTNECRIDGRPTSGNDERQHGHDSTKNASTTTTNGDHLFRSEDISPTVPFTHPDIQSTNCDGTTNSANATGHYPHSYEAPGQRSDPDYTEEGNFPLNGTLDADCTFGNGQRRISASDTGSDSRDNNAEQGTDPVDGAPDANGAYGANEGNPNGASDARVGIRGTHCGDQGTVSTNTNADTNGAPDANRRNQIGASDARVDANDTNDPDQGNVPCNGASDANKWNQSGARAPDTSINRNGAPDANGASDARTDVCDSNVAGQGNRNISLPTAIGVPSQGKEPSQ